MRKEGEIQQNMEAVSGTEQSPDLSLKEQEKQTEKPSEIIKRIMEDYAKLEEMFGKEGAEVTLEVAKTSGERKHWLVYLDRRTKLKEAKEFGFKELESLGFLERSPEGLLICDVEKIKNEMDHRILKGLGPLWSAKYYGNQNVGRTLAILFESVSVISKNDYKEGAREPKHLFYLPPDAETALDVNAIKKSQFYLSLSDLGRAGVSFKQYGDVRGLDYREVVLPLIIYHPKYCDGYRGEDGALYIRRDDKNDKYGRISANYLVRKYGQFGNPNNPGDSLNASRAFVSAKLPHLVEKGLLLPEDFEVYSTSSTGFVERRSAEINKSRGGIMFNRIRHNLGDHFYNARDKFVVYQLASDLGGVIDKKTGELRYIFDILKDEEKFKSKRGYGYAGPKDTNPRLLEEAHILE